MNKVKTWSSLGVLTLAVVAGVFSIEGGYVNDPNDSGGETNHGITVQVARDHGYYGAMKSLPKGLAQDIYINTYIKAPKYDKILLESPAVGTKLVDMGVNAGPGRSTKWFQQSLNDLSRGGRDYSKITVDGAIGPATIKAYQSLEKKRGDYKACELSLKMLDGYQTAHYTMLAQGKSNSSFIVGWLDHRIGNVSPERCFEKVEDKEQDVK